MITLQFVPYSEIEHLSSLGRIRKLLNIAKENKIVLLEGRLKKEEEKELIKVTMEEINEEFRGIELAVIEPKSKPEGGLSKLKKGVIDIILGERTGLTIIGPASIVKEIKKDPTKIELLTKDLKPKKKGKK
ncbi:MAG: DUF2073 domain-containing protein [Candidatus Woesearchaeota archaeon]